MHVGKTDFEHDGEQTQRRQRRDEERREEDDAIRVVLVSSEGGFGLYVIGSGGKINKTQSLQEIKIVRQDLIQK